ncbi:hypothetical protein MY11210_003615 [Beauveria gryllotalpidicola]
MKLALSIYAAALGAQLAAAGPSIIGGQRASNGSAPYIVSIQSMGTHICAGTLIRDNVVLTASHCLVDEIARALKVVAGSHSVQEGGVKREVAKGIAHADHDGIKRFNDIALLRLRRPFELTDAIRTVDLFQRQQIDAGTNVSIYGWGYTSFPAKQSRAPELQVLDRSIVDTAACNAAYFEYRGRNVTDNQVCTQAEGHGACRGDSGGPLVWTDDNGKEYQVGIVSFGIPCAKEWPDVATKVSPYLKWIEDNSA